MVMRKLSQMGCDNLSDEEIERCLSGCVAANKLTKIAKEMRDEERLTIESIVSFY
jgi:hypothetical protein